MAKLDKLGHILWTAPTILVPGAILFWASNDASAIARAAATFVGVSFGILCVFGYHMLTIPPLMEREGLAREDALTKTLESYSSPEEDADLREGIGWIVFREWGRTPWRDGGGRLDDFEAALGDVRRQAHRRKIMVWGRSALTDSLHAEISSDFFRLTGFDFMSFLDDQQETLTDQTQSVLPMQYRDLMINRAEFEREWPKG